jgi:hypothetical protein
MKLAAMVVVVVVVVASRSASMSWRGGHGTSLLAPVHEPFGLVALAVAGRAAAAPSYFPWSTMARPRTNFQRSCLVRQAALESQLPWKYTTTNS